MADIGFEDENSAEEILLPCTVCNRTFRPKALAKHSKVCEKSLVKKRKKFDSSKQRIQGTDLAEFLPLVVASKKAEKSPVRKSQSKWKEKHLEFVRAIRAARVGEELGKSSQQAAPKTPLDHERCPHCDRCFGPKAYERHEEWCKEQQARIQHHAPAPSEAKQRLEARTKYRAPPLSKSKRSLTKEKYASIGHSSQALLPTTNLTSGGSNTSNAVDSTKSPHFMRSSLRASQRQNRERAAAAKAKPGVVARRERSGSRDGRGGPLPPSSRVAEMDATQQLSTERHIPALLHTSKTQKQHSNSTTRANTTTETSREGPQSGVRGEKYDPYISAERQMLELLGTTAPDSPPSPPRIVDSPASAFTKVSPKQHLPAMVGEERNGETVVDFSLPPPTRFKDHDEHTSPLLSNRLSLSSLSLCSSISIDSVENTRNLRRGQSVSAKERPSSPRPVAPLRSISVVNPPQHHRPSLLKNKLKMEDLLFGSSGDDDQQENRIVDNTEKELIESMSKLKKLFIASKSPPLPMDASDQNESCDLKDNNKSYIDSAYNSLNRGGVGGANEVALFCHECGAKYPVTTAKFCCQCGLRRIVI